MIIVSSTTKAGRRATKEFKDLRDMVDQFQTNVDSADAMGSTDNGGSENEFVVITSDDKETSLRQFVFDDLNPNDDPSNWYIHITGGHRMRLVSEEGTDVASVLKYRTVDNPVKNSIARRGNSGIRFSMGVGKVEEFRMHVNAAKKERSDGTDPRDMVYRIGSECYTNDGKVEETVDVKLALNRTFKTYSTMSCFFVCMALYCIQGPFMDKIRSLMGVDTDDTIARKGPNPQFYISNKTKSFISELNGSKARRNVLLYNMRAVCRSVLKKCRFNINEPVTSECIREILLKMNLRTIMIGDCISQRMNEHMTQYGVEVDTGVRKGGECNRSDNIELVSSKFKYNDFPTIMCIFESDNKKHANGKQEAILLLKVSDRLKSVMHIEPELSLTKAVTYDDTIVPNSKLMGVSIYSRSQMKVGPGGRNIEWTNKKVMASEILAKNPVYIQGRAQNVRPFDEHLTTMDIDTMDQLDEFISDISELISSDGSDKDNNLLTYNVIRIAREAYPPFNQTPQGMYEGMDMGSYPLPKHNLKSILDLIMAKESKKIVIMSSAIELESAHSLLKKASNKNRKETELALIRRERDLIEFSDDQDHVDLINKTFYESIEKVNIPVTHTEEVRQFKIEFKQYPGKGITIISKLDSDNVCMHGLLARDPKSKLKTRLLFDGKTQIDEKRLLRDKYVNNPKKADRLKTVLNQLSNAKDEERWLKIATERIDPVMGMLGDESIVIGRKNNKDVRRKPNTQLIAGIDSEYVETIKGFNTREMDDAPIAICTSHANYSNGPTYEFDFSSFYPQLGMGMGNTALYSDIYGMYPQFGTPNNCSLQDMGGRPCVSHFSDVGTLNLYPRDVDIKRLLEFNPAVHRQHSSLRRFISPGIRDVHDTSSCVNSVTLIQWSIEMINARAVKYSKQYSVHEKYELIKTFQLDILGIKTGRFIHPERVRNAIGYKLKGRRDTPFYDKGKEFINNEVSLANEFRVGLSSCQIIPNDMQLLTALPMAKGVLDIRQYGINPDLLTGIGMFHDAILNTLTLILAYALQVMKIRRLEGMTLKDGYKITRSDVKMCLNKSIGVCRQSGSIGHTYTKDMHMVDYKDVQKTSEPLLIHEEEEEGMAHVLISNLPLNKKVLFVHYTMTSSVMRGSFDPWRTRILVSSVALIDRICDDISPRPILRIQVDSLLVFEEDVDDITRALNKYTKHVEDCDKTDMPGYGRAYTKTTITEKVLRKEIKYKNVIDSISSTPLRPPSTGCFVTSETVQIDVSSVKKSMDSIVTPKIYYEDEEMYKYYKNHRSTLDNLKGTKCTEMELIKDGGTIKDFGRFIAVNVTKCASVKKFVDRYTKFISSYLYDEYKCCGQLIGGPGTGKTTFAKSLADKYKAKNKDKKTCFSAPFNAVKNASKCKSFDYSETSHAIAGCKRDINVLTTDAYNYIERKGELARGARFKPLKLNIGLWIFDEVQSTPAPMQEAWKILATVKDTQFLFIHDKYQAPSVNGNSVDVHGAVVNRLGAKFIFNKNVEFRNTDVNYIDSKYATRNGDVMKYIDDSMCDYKSGRDAIREFGDTIKNVASNIVSNGYTKKVVVCQNWKIASIVVTNVVRCMILMGYKHDFALVHLGTGLDRSDSNESLTDQKECEILIKGLYNAWGSAHDKKTLHNQGTHGLPMLFGPKCRYSVIDAFKRQFMDVDTNEEGKPNTKNNRLFKNDVLEYISYEDVYCEADTKEEVASQTIRIITFRLIGLNGKGGDLIKLTEDEASHYLMYTFVAQQVGLIGLTLDDVVTVQVSLGFKDSYTRAYHPIKETLVKAANELGPHAWMSSIARMLHVVLTRVRTGHRTCILDVSYHNIFFRDILYNALIGRLHTHQDCNGLTIYNLDMATLYNLSDRSDTNYMKNIRTGFTKSIRRRMHKWKKSDGINLNANSRSTWLDFPSNRLESVPVEQREIVMRAYLDTLISSAPYTGKRKNKW